MHKLVDGVHKFQKEYFGKNKELFERLAKGQKPETLFITCSDSRINPALVTQTEPGDIFIVRNAGNIIPPFNTSSASGEIATVEFAVKGLGVKDIIICGHSHCGAMKALLEPGMTDEMPSMRRWLEHAEITRNIVNEKYKDLPKDQLVNVCIQENVLAQLENLRTHPAVAARLALGTLRLHAWVYKFETGDVFAYDVEEGQFLPLQNKEQETAQQLGTHVFRNGKNGGEATKEKV
ncbi:MAG TPA: carbonic anhydrase [Myxococcaceae bacterium]|nr:carbonic anhydrase [Myxococcaceae bacterium]